MGAGCCLQCNLVLWAPPCPLEERGAPPPPHPHPPPSLSHREGLHANGPLQLDAAHAHGAALDVLDLFSLLCLHVNGADLGSAGEGLEGPRMGRQARPRSMRQNALPPVVQGSTLLAHPCRAQPLLPAGLTSLMTSHSSTAVWMWMTDLWGKWKIACKTTACADMQWLQAWSLTLALFLSPPSALCPLHAPTRTCSRP
jgi:hypothetical protein